jgi:hypothetical protein
METVGFDIQFGLGGGAFDLDAFDPAFGGSSWVSVADVRTVEPPVLEYGIRGSAPDDRIADAGALTFALNNGAWNAAGTLGWYSPLQAIRRGGFDFNIPVRLVLTYAGTPYYKFYGRLGNISVVPGAHEERLVRCTALDLIDDYARLPVPALDAQFNQRGDQLVQAVLDALPADLQPPLRAIETGLDTHPIAFDNLHEETITVREALNEICLSDLGKLYMVGTTAEPGGLLVYRNRHYAALNPTVAFAFDNDMARGGLMVPGSRDDLISTLQVFTHPTRVDTGASTVLYALETTATLVQPGEVNDTLFGPYRDPANPGDRVGGTHMVPPVAVTDYTMNSAQDGTGLDVTANFTVAASFTGSGVRFTITNNGAVAGYVTKLQCRGDGIYRFTAVVEKVVDAAYGERLLQLDMPFQSNVNVGADMATYLAMQLSQPLARVTSVTFLANLTPAMMTAALQCEPGSRIAITEDVTGLDAQEFVINGVRLEFQPASTMLLWCTWYLEPADVQRYWIWGLAHMGSDTIFGF